MVDIDYPLPCQRPRRRPLFQIPGTWCVIAVVFVILGDRVGYYAAGWIIMAGIFLWHLVPLLPDIIRLFKFLKSQGR